MPYDPHTSVIPTFSIDSSHPTVVLSVLSRLQPSLSGLVLQSKLAIGIHRLQELAEQHILPEQLTEVSKSLLGRDVLLHRDESVRPHERANPLVYTCPTTTRNVYVIFGASHAKRLATHLSDIGHVVFDLSISGWRVSRDTVHDMLQSLKCILHLLPSRTVFVYCMA